MRCRGTVAIDVVVICRGVVLLRPGADEFGRALDLEFIEQGLEDLQHLWRVFHRRRQERVDLFGRDPPGFSRRWG